MPLVAQGANSMIGVFLRNPYHCVDKLSEMASQIVFLRVSFVGLMCLNISLLTLMYHSYLRHRGGKF